MHEITIEAYKMNYIPWENKGIIYRREELKETLKTKSHKQKLDEACILEEINVIQIVLENYQSTQARANLNKIIEGKKARKTERKIISKTEFINWISTSLISLDSLQTSMINQYLIWWYQP